MKTAGGERRKRIHCILTDPVPLFLSTGGGGGGGIRGGRGKGRKMPGKEEGSGEGGGGGEIQPLKNLCTIISSIGTCFAIKFKCFLRFFCFA